MGEDDEHRRGRSRNAVGLLGAGLSGCSGSVKVETKSTPSVSAADLQKDLSDELSSAGMTVKSVTCKDDTVGEVEERPPVATSTSTTPTVSKPCSPR